MRTQGGPGGMGGAGGMPPPPPPGNGNDQGFSKDELTSMVSSASASGSSDSRTDLMATIAANFDAADADQDGRVTGKEAMTYQQSQATSEADATYTTGNKTADSLQMEVMQRIMQLMQAYGGTDANSTWSDSGGASSLSALA